jgi:hypothetical protein
MIAPKPSQPVRGLCLLVSPIGNPIRTGKIARKLILQRSHNFDSTIPVAFAPSGKVIDMGHPIPLLAVAFAVRQHEIVTEINGILRPRNEMIDMAAIAPDGAATVEALPVLQIHQHGPSRPQCSPFGTEQELA